MKSHLSALLFAFAARTMLAGSPQILIPAAASAPGANGTYFRTDVTIVSTAALSQSVEVRWLPEPGGSPVTKTLTVSNFVAFRSADFVHDFLGQSGLGSVVMTGVDATGAIDPTAQLYVAARIWTDTASQTLPTLAVSDIHTPVSAKIAGAAGPPNDYGSYRTNVGIVNLDPKKTQTFDVMWTPRDIGDKYALVEVAVPPMSMTQVPLLFPPGPFGLISITNITASAASSDSWIAYGSTIDNATGSAWSQLAFGVSPNL